MAQLSLQACRESRSSCILYKSEEDRLFLIDIPLSIEEAQGNDSMRILSEPALETAYSSLEPKSAKAKASAQELPISELILCKKLEFALKELQAGYVGPYCLSRITHIKPSKHEAIQKPLKRKRQSIEDIEPAIHKNDRNTEENISNSEPPLVGHGKLAGKCNQKVPQQATKGIDFFNDGSFAHYNKSQVTETILTDDDAAITYIPPMACVLCGSIAAILPYFKIEAPDFSLVILDPPWPNRSARRSNTYDTSYDATEIRQLLASIPLEDKLVDHGVVAIWITNKTAFKEMVIGDNGLFAQWGLQLVEEWIWLKTTRSGQPICALNATWRKPYEILLVGRKGLTAAPRSIETRVLVGVPDLHSRKPHLKQVFARSGFGDTLQGNCLEIFARNLTAGWTAWGQEVLKFQNESSWVEMSSLEPDFSNLLQAE